MDDPALADLARLLAARRTPGAPLVVGLTGSVAAGKSALAAALVEALAQARPGLAAVTVSTDGFLRSNAELDAAGLTLRKGRPETYDHVALAQSLHAIRRGPTRFPGYSHLTYDVDPALARTLEPPDILIIEGLGFRRETPLDVRLFLEAQEAHLEAWYVARFLLLARAGRADPAAFYHRFAALDDAGIEAFARQVWSAINLPTLHEAILPLRAACDLVIEKGPDHRIARIAPPGEAAAMLQA